MNLREITFAVIGVAQPQGSARAFLVGRRPVITHDNPRVRSWRREIYVAAEEALAPWVSHGLTAPAWPRPAALRCAVSVWLPRPQSLPRRVLLPAGRPDADKLLRACLDALTGLVWADDSQVCEAWVAKSYGYPPRAEFHISLLEPLGCPTGAPGRPEDSQAGTNGDLFATVQFGAFPEGSGGPR